MLRRWLALDGEQRSGAPVERSVGHGLGSQDLGDAATDVVRGKQRVEHAARVRVLLVAPLPHIGIVPVLEPTIVVHDLHAVHDVMDCHTTTGRRLMVSCRCRAAIKPPEPQHCQDSESNAPS